MTREKMAEMLKNEHQCMLRRTHDGCDKNCADCELALDDGDLHEMYTDVIWLLGNEKERKEPCEAKTDDNLPLMLDDTKDAFESCFKNTPECEKCPATDLCGRYVKKGKIKVKESVLYWLSQVEEKE